MQKKVKKSHYTPLRRLEEWRYSSYSFPNSALDEGEWSASRPGRALPRRKDPRYPLYRRLGGTQRLEEKSFAPAGDRTQIAQPVVRHYTTWANPAPLLEAEECKMIALLCDTAVA
jgi:hypothetical protein